MGDSAGAAARTAATRFGLSWEKRRDTACKSSGTQPPVTAQTSLQQPRRRRAPPPVHRNNRNKGKVTRAQATNEGATPVWPRQRGKHQHREKNGGTPQRVTHQSPVLPPARVIPRRQRPRKLNTRLNQNKDKRWQQLRVRTRVCGERQAGRVRETDVDKQHPRCNPQAPLRQCQGALTHTDTHHINMAHYKRTPHTHVPSHLLEHLLQRVVHHDV